MADDVEDTHPAALTASRDGRVTIPAQMRRAAGLEPGSRLVLYVEDGRVVIEERDHLLERIQREAIDAANEAGLPGSAVDELIADRRAEAAREADETTAPTRGKRSRS